MNHFYSSDPKAVYNYTIDFPNTWGCFGQIRSHYEEGKQFYVGFPVEESFMYRFVEGFNNYYSTIKMEIVDTINYYQRNDTYYGYLIYREDILPKNAEKSNYDKHTFFLWTLHFQEQSEFVRYCFYVIVGELLRLDSYSRTYERSRISKEGDIFVNTIEYAKSVTHRRFGNPFYVDISDDFMPMFDNAEEINQYLIPGKYRYDGYDYIGFNGEFGFNRSMFPTHSYLVVEMNRGNIPNRARKVSKPKVERTYYRDSEGKFISRERYMRLNRIIDISTYTNATNA